MIFSSTKPAEIKQKFSMKNSKSKVGPKEEELLDDLSNFGLSGGDYSPISHTFFKQPVGDATNSKATSKCMKKN